MKRHGKDERGIALLFCLLALLILSAIGASMIFMSGTETAINNNYRLEQRAYFAALAGVEEVRQRMSIKGSLTMPTVLPTTTGGVLYILNPAGSTDVVQPWNSANKYFDAELCHENFYTTPANPGNGIRCTSAPSGGSWYTTTVSTAPFYNTAAALDYKWVRVTLKANGTRAPFYVNGSSAAGTLNTMVCFADPGNEQVIPAGYTTCKDPVHPIYIVTSLAVTPTGSRKMVQSELAQPIIGPFPGALTLDGPGATASSPSSSSFGITGTDTGVCGSTVNPAIALDGSPSSIALRRAANYTGTPPPSPPIVAGASVVDIASTISPNLATPSAIQTQINNITTIADQVLTGPITDPPGGTTANPLITVVNGDLTLSGSFVGTGLLVVTGVFNTNGNTTFNGVVLVVGKGIWTSSGGGTGIFNGGFIIAKIYDAAGNLLPSLGAPTWDWSGGGTNSINYDTCAIDNATSRLYFNKLSTHEPLY